MVRCGVANIVNKKNGKKYTIRFTDLDKRIKDYLINLERGNFHNKQLQNDYDKYGNYNFEVETVFEGCKESEINERGKSEIQNNGDKSYNIVKEDVQFDGGNLDAKFGKSKSDTKIDFRKVFNILDD